MDQLRELLNSNDSKRQREFFMQLKRERDSSFAQWIKLMLTERLEETLEKLVDVADNGQLWMAAGQLRLLKQLLISIEEVLYGSGTKEE